MLKARRSVVHKMAVLAAVLSLMTLPASGAAGVTGSVQITGTVGEIVDAAAGTDFVGQAGYFLRYVGDPAPAGYSHDYQWGQPYIETVSPETTPVTFTGTLDLSSRQLSTVAFIGLNDKASHAAGWGGGGDATAVWTDGANIYVGTLANGDVRIGPSDGNAGGGEYLQVSHTVPAATVDADPVWDVTFVIDGTADPTTCAGVATDAGCMTLTVEGLTPLSDSYGAKLAPDSSDPEFDGGGIPGWDASHSEGGDVGYDLTVSPVLVDDDAPPGVTEPVADPNPAPINASVTLTTTATDALSDIASVEYTLDGGTSWGLMAAADGTFDSTSEDATVDLAGPADPGVYEDWACVRATDAAANTSDGTACVTLVVYDPSGGFVTGGGWIDSPEGATSPDATLVGPDAFGTSWHAINIADDGAWSLVTGPATPPIGVGSVELSVVDGDDKITVFNYDYMGTELADVTALSYATYQNSTTLAPALQMEIDPDGPAISGVDDYATLNFEPYYNNAVAADTWQTWDVLTAGAGVWATGFTSEGSISQPVTWARFLELYPNATIKYGFGVNAGSGWSSFVGNVDALTIGTTGSDPTVYDFEPFAPSGKATFGFVAKYKKGADIPDGNTVFVFQAGGIELASTAYDWLVVQGDHTAMFRGTAVVNDVAGHSFQLWAGDDPDTFRIVIWAPGGGKLYDSGEQPLGGGNIVIHRK